MHSPPSFEAILRRTTTLPQSTNNVFIGFDLLSAGCLDIPITRIPGYPVVKVCVVLRRATLVLLAIPHFHCCSSASCHPFWNKAFTLLFCQTYPQQ